MSMFSKVAKKASGVASGLLGFGGTPGPENPYGRPDLAYLRDTGALDFLKNIQTPTAVNTFADAYKPPTGTSDLAFNDLLGNINAPSSVDDVNRELDNDRLRQILEGVDTDARHTVGSLKSDFADRGLSGPGVGSDIEFNALAQAYGDADKTKSNARMDLAQKELERLKAKETAVQGAYGERYATKAGEDTQGRQIAATGAAIDVNATNAAREAAAGRTQQGQLTFANLLNGRDLGAAGINSTNYNTAVDTQNKYAKPGFWETILGNTQIKLGI